MNKKVSNIVLSLSAILALSACGTNNDYKASSNLVGEGSVVNPKIKDNNPTKPDKVNKDDKKEQKTFKLVEDISKKVSWEKLHKDETVTGSTVCNDKFVSYSFYHNKLAIVDLSSSNPNLLENKKFLNVIGDRNNVDGSTGASEQVLTKVELAKDCGLSYSLLTKYKDSSKDIGVGIYKTNMATGIVSDNFAKITKGSDFYNDETIIDIALSEDNTKLLALSKDKEVLIFDAMDLSKAKKVISTEKTPKSGKIDNSGAYVFVGLYKRNKSSLGIYNLETKKLQGEYITIKYAPNMIVQENNNTIFVTSDSENKLYKLDISSKSNITLKDTYEFDNDIKSLAITKDKKYILALAGKKLFIIDIKNNTKKLLKEFDKEMDNIFSIENNKVIISYSNNLAYYNLEEGK